MTSNNQDHNNA